MSRQMHLWAWRKSSHKQAAAEQAARAMVEALEPRQLLSGTEYLVNSLADTIAADNQLTLREAIEASNTNTAVNEAPAGSSTQTNIIRFDPALFASGPGTIRLSGSELKITSSLVILGPGQDLLTIDADGKSRVINTSSPDLTLDGLTITGGAVTGYAGTGWGGGILNTGPCILSNLVITGNAARLGGGLYTGASLPVTLINVTISQNRADRGGGIYNGTIYNSGSLLISGGRICDNVASGVAPGCAGGGVFSASGMEITLDGTFISGNWAHGDGGGLYISDGAATLNNVTVYGNSASSHGSGVFALGGHNAFTNVTIVRNTTFYGVDAAYLDSSCTLRNCLIADNQGAHPTPDILGSICSDSSGNLIGAYASSLPAGNVSGTLESPLDPKLGELTEINGSLVFPLLPGSPALNAGNNAATGALTTDQVGNPRIADGVVDIGAVEGAFAPRPAVTYVVTSLADTVAADGVLTFREAFEAANSNKPVGDAPAGSFSERDRIVFAPGLSGTINASASWLSIQGSIAIEGPGTDQLVFSGDGKTRVIEVTQTGDAQISGIRISGGAGGIENSGTMMLRDAIVSDNALINDPSSNYGGGISNSGTMLLVNVTVRDNRVSSDRTPATGGGIGNGGTLTLLNVTVCGNSATSPGLGLAGGLGGGIYAGGDLTIINTTISGNSADSEGGGIWTAATTTITSSTITANTAKGPGGGLKMYFNLPMVTINSSIVAENTSLTTAYHDLYGFFGTPNDYNVIGVTDTWQLGAHSLRGTSQSPLDPKLGPLTEINGRLVHPLLPGSPALNAGSNVLAVDTDGNPLLTDAAGQPRIAGGTVDIGAFEYQPQVLAISGTEGKDAIELTSDESNFIYSINSNPALKMPRSLVTALKIDASGGDELSFDVDLQTTDLLIQADPASHDQLLASICQSIASARNTSPLLWKGKGITSSAARDDASRYTGLAAILNQDVLGNPLYSTFAGQAVDVNSILVKYTFNGDADLNGTTDGADYFLIDVAYLGTRARLTDQPQAAALAAPPQTPRPSSAGIAQKLANRRRGSASLLTRQSTKRLRQTYAGS